MFITKITWGRILTDEEQATRIARNVELTTAGETNGRYALSAVGDYWLHQWNTLQAAQDWVTYSNTFTPPPVSAEALELAKEEVESLLGRGPISDSDIQ